MATKKEGPRGENKRHAHHGKTSVLDAGLTIEETRILTTLRLFCTTYANPRHQTWELAFETSQRDFGPIHGPQIGMAVMNVMRALRSTRRTTFRFTNPACDCCSNTLSDHELHMMTLLQAERRGDGIARQTHAVILCEGEDPHMFLACMEELAVRLNAFAAPSACADRSRKRLQFSYARQSAQ